jgi:HEPN domain-containing protein
MIVGATLLQIAGSRIVAMELKEIIVNIRQKYRDAMLLANDGRNMNAMYLAGYCVELALKYAIAKNLNWDSYRTEGKYKFLKVHDLELLVSLTGDEAGVKKLSSWAIAKEWSEELRYKNPTEATESMTRDMLDASKDLVKRLCRISLKK